MPNVISMKKSRAPLVIVVMAIIIVGVLAVGINSGLIKIGSFSVGETSQCGYTYELVGIDDYGNEINIPVHTNVLQSAFSVSGVEVTSIEGKVGWDVSRSGVDWSTLAISGTIKVYLATSLIQGDSEIFSDGAPSYTLMGTIPFISNNQTGTYDKVFVLGSDIATLTDSNKIAREEFKIVPPTDSHWWVYKFVCSLTATITGELGEPISDTQVLGEFGVVIIYGATINVGGYFNP